MPSQSAEDEKLNAAALAKLDRILAAVQFDAVGFADTIDFMRDIWGANIYVRWSVLEAAGVGRNTPVSLSLHNAKFGKALELLLDNAGEGRATLTYSIDRGVIVITSSDAVPVTLITHDVKQLLADKPELTGILAHQIESAIDPKAWQEAGGKKGMIQLTDGKLYVAQTLANQKLVSDYLSQLVKEQRKNAQGKPAGTQKD